METNENKPVADEGSATAPAASGVVSEGTAAAVSDAPAVEASTSSEPVDGASGEPVPDVVSEQAVPAEPLAPHLTEEQKQAILDNAPKCDGGTPILTPEQLAALGDDTPPEPTEGDGTEPPVQPPTPEPTDEAEEEADEDVTRERELFDELKGLTEDIVYDLNGASLDDFRQAYTSLEKEWQRAAQIVHVKKHGNPLREQPLPNTGVTLPCSLETLAWLVAFLGRLKTT